VVTSHIDITAQKLAEGKVNNTLQFFEQISGTIPDMMYVFDRVDRDILFFNEHGIDILGKDKEFIYKKGIDLFLTIIHADDLESYKAHLEECSKLSARDVKELELRIKIKGEDYRWFWIRETAFKSDKNGNALQILGIARDIQMQKTTRNALIKCNQELDSQNTELRHFNSITGNDFKENLKKVYTSLEFIASNDARHLSNEGRANIRRTQSAIQKMRLLTDDISAYSGLFELEPDFSMVNPNEIIKNVLIKLREPIRRTGANIEITHFPKMYADSFMMTSLLFNLVDNAIKFRKQILPPHIRIKYVQADEINFDERAIKDTPHGIVSVSDNGIGLRDTEAEKIFDLFYRKEDESKYKGLGIGLAICKRIMSIHRGFITAEGTPAAGSTFSCYFPLHQLL
jgi:PAS domain S-box-containing protein